MTKSTAEKLTDALYTGGYLEKRNGRYGIGAATQNIQISLKNRYVYLMVCKAASSTVTHHLRTAECFGTNLEVGYVNDPRHSPHVLPYQLSSEEFIGIMNSREFRKVTFVRNPYSRLLSCYLHRIVADKRINPSQRCLFQQSEFSKENLPSFKEFVRFVCAQKTQMMERHWRVQFDSVFGQLLELDFVGKQEHLVEDLRLLEQFLWADERFDSDKLNAVRAGPSGTNATKSIREYFDEETQNLVATRFKEDFDNFGYSTDISATF